MKITTSELQNIIAEEVAFVQERFMSGKFRKAIEKYQELQVQQQKLQKAFVGTKDTKKREKLKAALVVISKKVKAAEADFNRALHVEPVDMYEGKLNEITLKGKDAEGWIKNWGAGGRVNINNMIYKSLGKGKWKGPNGEKLSWIEVSAKASALGDKRVFFEGKLNEISVKAGFADIQKGRTTAIEGIKVSKDMVAAIMDWMSMSAYGRKYHKQIMKARFASLIPVLGQFGLERFLSPKLKKEWKAIMAKYGSKKESVTEAFDVSKLTGKTVDAFKKHVIKKGEVKGTYAGRPVILKTNGNKDIGKWTVTFSKTNKTAPFVDAMANLKIEGKVNENVGAAYNALLKVSKDKNFIKSVKRMSVSQLKKVKADFEKGYFRGNRWTGSKEDMKKYLYVMALMKDKGWNQFEGKMNEDDDKYNSYSYQGDNLVAAITPAENFDDKYKGQMALVITDVMSSIARVFLVAPEKEFISKAGRLTKGNVKQGVEKAKKNGLSNIYMPKKIYDKLDDVGFKNKKKYGANMIQTHSLKPVKK